MSHYAMLRTKKVEPSKYEVLHPDTSEPVGVIVRTGEYSRDDYPWDWHFTVEMPLIPRLTDREGNAHRSALMGNTDTKRDALDTMSALWAEAHKPGSVPTGEQYPSEDFVAKLERPGADTRLTDALRPPSKRGQLAEKFAAADEIREAALAELASQIPPTGAVSVARMEAALSTLADLTTQDHEELTGKVRDEIANVRTVLHELIEKAER